MTFGQMADAGRVGLVDPDRDELGQPGTRRVEHTERSVARVDEFGGRFGDASEHHRQAQLRADGHDGVK